MFNSLQQNPSHLKPTIVHRSLDYGNSIAEYALIGVLVIVVCIVALQALSSGLSTAMAMVHQNMKTGIVAKMVQGPLSPLI